LKQTKLELGFGTKKLYRIRNSNSNQLDQNQKSNRKNTRIKKLKRKNTSIEPMPKMLMIRKSE